MSVTDCLILGFYDYPFADYVGMVRSIGERSGSYRDLALAFVEHEGRPQRALDILTRFFYEARPEPARPFNNADFLWPVVTYLTTYLQRRGFAVDHVNLPHFESDELRRKLQGGEVRTVAITTTLYVSPHAILDLVALVRRFSPQTRIIVGGPYISNQAETMPRADLSRLLTYLGADIYVLCQEGEATLAAVVAALRQGGELAAAANLAYLAGAEIAYTAKVPESNPLVENLVDYRLFSPQERGEFITTRTAKSCPFACSFCGFPERAGEYNYLGVADVEREFDAIRDCGGVSTVTIIDDTYNVPKGRFKEILRMMIRNRYDFKWNCFYRADQGDEEAIELMAAAGCEGVFLGVESGSDAMLQRMNKRSRREHYLRAIPLLNAAGISTYASLIVGFPGETEATVRETIDLVEEARPEFYRAQLWYADPVTPIWKERERYGVTGVGFNWAHDTMDVDRACDWIDTMFLQIDGSIWLPQFGFEQWSTFYLQRHGMRREQLRTFLASFNALIKHRLVSFGEPPAPELVDNLRLSCQFDRPESAAARAPERWSGRAYTAACEALAAELAGGGEEQELASEVSGVPCNLLAAGTCECDLETVAAPRQIAPATAAELALAAYAAVVALDGGSRTILAQPPGAAPGLPVPVRARAALDASLADWVVETRERLASLMPYRELALAICSNPVWRHRHPLSAPALRHGFATTEGPADVLPSWVEPATRYGLGEVLVASCGQGRLSLALYTRPGAVPELARDRLERVMDLMQGAAANPAIRAAEAAPFAENDEAFAL
jgi:anaerobic magnesium-protoporphyrin IX monomethyl ester cyclase